MEYNLYAIMAVQKCFQVHILPSTKKKQAKYVNTIIYFEVKNISV